MRSYLYVPGIDTKRLAKALTVGTDAVIVDLEDAVPMDRKGEGLATARDWVAGLPTTAPQAWVRVESGTPGLAQIAALADCPNLAGIVLAKADLDTVEAAVALLRDTPIALAPLLETAGAVLTVGALAAAGVDHLQIGEYDLSADVGISPGPDEAELAYARAQVVFASRAAGLKAPVAPVSIEIRDTEAFTLSTQRAMRQGFVGRACIHPAQVEIVNALFTPSEAEVEAARALLARFAELEGSAVMVDESGRMVDEATIRTARRTVGLAISPADR